MIIKLKKISSLLLILLFGCPRDVDISEFSNDFSGYEPEIRIEALILPGESTAVVRIDQSALITDTDIYNCIDDDGDWDINHDDLGIDGVPGDPTDDNENCPDFGAEADDDCYTEDSIGENNGLPDCGEPHVDETDEIITLLHINNCDVRMINGDTTCDFIYDEYGGSFWYSPYRQEKDELTFIEESYYGAYIPGESCSTFNWSDYDADYEFECDCGDYGTIVSKEPIQISPPVVFFNESDVQDLENFLVSSDECTDIECLKENSTLWEANDNNYDKRYFARYAVEDYIYYSSLLPHVAFQSVQYFYDPNEDRYIYFHGHADAASDACDECGIHQNITTMKEAVVTDILEFNDTIITNIDTSFIGTFAINYELTYNDTITTDTIIETIIDTLDNDSISVNEIISNYQLTTVDNYYYEMFTFSDSYRDYYFYDQLDLLDPERTNLRERDENGEITGIMVMGAFGSMTSDKMYFEIIDCENYETQQDCEDESLTQSVCMWYEWPEPYGDICLPKKLPNLD